MQACCDFFVLFSLASNCSLLVLPFSTASKALACLNYSKLKGKPMRIMWCQRDPSRRKAGNANLFVKNLNPSISSARLQSIFCQYGNILSCKVAEDNGLSKGFGFVQFESEESAMNALRALHDTMLEGKKMYALCCFGSQLINAIASYIAL